MPQIDWLSVAAGVLAYAVAAVGSIILVFLLFRWGTGSTGKNKETYLAERHRSMAIALGVTILSQAILLRHAVFPIMTVVRDLFLRGVSFAAVVAVLLQAFFFFAVIGGLSIGSVWLAVWLFDRLTGQLKEKDEINKDNVAVAIFYAFVLLAITAILNEGIEDLAHSIIPYGRSGVVRLP